MHSDGYFTSLLRLWSAHASGLLHFSSVRHHIPACGGYHGKRLVLMLAIIEKGGVQPLPFSCDKLLRQNPFKIVSSAPGMLRIGRPRSCRWGGRPAAICPAPQSGRQRVCFFHAAYQIIATQMRGSLSLFLRNCGMLTRKGNTGKGVRNNDQYF